MVHLRIFNCMVPHDAISMKKKDKYLWKLYLNFNSFDLKFICYCSHFLKGFILSSPLTV